MGYNQGLAVGLAVGLPCFIVFVGVFFFYRRNRRMQRKEDLDGNDFDVEMGENGLFKEFGEALHRPVLNTPHKIPNENKTPVNGRPQTADTTVVKALSSTESVLNSNSSKTQSVDRRPHYSVKNYSPEKPNSSSGRPGSAFTQGRTNSAYDIYDSVIPIMESEPLQEPLLGQPPALSGNSHSERHSLHSSRGSLIGGDSLTRSLDNLAKQLQNPLFFDKTPSRANTTLTKPPQYLNPRIPPQKSSAGSSMVDLSAHFEQGGVNDHFVNERSALLNEQEAPQLHPYRKRLFEQKDSKDMDLERNFDNNITPDTGFTPQPDVVYK